MALSHGGKYLRAMCFLGVSVVSVVFIILLDTLNRAGSETVALHLHSFVCRPVAKSRIISGLALALD